MTTRADIVRLVGEVDELTIAEILKTDASLTDIERAARWAAGDAAARPERRELSGRAEAVYDVLIGDPLFAPTVDADDR